MHQADHEAISALLDGEADDLELRRLLKSLESESESSEELLRQWQRFHLAQDVLHDRGVPVSADLAGRISAQIAEEPAHQQKASSSVTPSWQQTMGKFAVAASVAAVFVVMFQVNLAPNSPATAPAVAELQAPEQAAPAAQPQMTLVAGNEEFVMDPAAEERLRLFLEGPSLDVSEPIVTEQIQDSPLFRLVNQRQD